MKTYPKYILLSMLAIVIVMVNGRTISSSQSIPPKRLFRNNQHSNRSVTVQPRMTTAATLPGKQLTPAAASPTPTNKITANNQQIPIMPFPMLSNGGGDQVMMNVSGSYGPSSLELSEIADSLLNDDGTIVGTGDVKDDQSPGRRMVIVWRNPYPLDNYTEMLLLGRNEPEDDHHYQPPHPHEFDEMEQRDLLRTVIFLANAQMNIKFKLCEMRRFRSDFRPRWNLYRCSARFTVTRIGKECHPENSYDGYVNFIVQNPELPPLLSIRYYVFQFLYEEAFGFVKKINQQQQQ